MRVAQVNESAHANSLGNLIPPTDRPTDQPTVRVPWADHRERSSGLDDPTLPARDGRPRVRGCWIEKRTEVQRR